jgi:hypothetical protein
MRKKKPTEKEKYEYIRAIVDCGELRWEYKMVGSEVIGRMAHDEDVSQWSDEEIIDVTCAMLDVEDGERDKVSVRVC